MTHDHDDQPTADVTTTPPDQLAIILQSVADGITAQDPDGRLIYANDAAARIVGYPSAHALMDAPVHEVLQGFVLRDASGCPFPVEQLPGRRALRDMPNPPETTLCFRVVATGEERWAVVRASPVLDNEGRVRFAVNIFHDITERRQAEVALREKEAQYHRVFEATTDGLVIRDLDGRIVEANPAMCALHGYTKDELLRLASTAVIHPDYHAQFADCLRAVKAGQPFRAERMDLRKDGTAFHVEIHETGFSYLGQPHVLGVVRDITDRVEAYTLLEQRVAERTRELATLLEISHNLASTIELRPLLGLILDQVAALVDYLAGAVAIVQGDDLAILAYRGPLPVEQVVGTRVPLAWAGSILPVSAGTTPVIIDDTQSTTPLAAAIRALLRERTPLRLERIRSCMLVRLAVKERVVGMLAFGHAQPHYYTPTHAALVQAVADQAAVAIEHARLYEQAQEVAVIAERQRLARELHDSVTQSLYSVSLLAEAGRRLAGAGELERVQGYLDRLGQTAQQALEEMRLLVYELRPASLEQEGLVGALQRRLDAVEQRGGVEARLLVESSVDLCLPIAETLYRIAQEALNNALKHAGATNVVVVIRADREQAQIEVVDDGRGFDLHAPRDRGGLGLISMQERAERLGGDVMVVSAPGSGTRVLATVPTCGAAELHGQAR